MHSGDGRDDEELDALIYEAIRGESMTPVNTTTISPQQQQQLLRVPQAQMPSATILTGGGMNKKAMTSAPHLSTAGSERPPSPDSSDADSEAMLQAVLAGCGLPSPKGFLLPQSQQHTNRTELPNQVKAKEDAGEAEEEETILMQALLHLTSPPQDLVPKSRRQSTEPKAASTSEEISTAKATRRRKGLFTSSTIVGGNGNAKSGTTAAMGLTESNGNGENSQNAVSASQRRTRFPLYSPSSGGPASLEVLDMEDEKQILTAILNAVHDRQSSVSGELVCGEDEHNVEAVLQHAEQIAASSLCEKNGQVSRILHLHEHIEMREELRKARGSVGWPSCVSTQASPVVIEGNPPKGRGPLLSTSTGKRPSLCIGTTLGIVLLFDAKKKLCGMCGSITASSVAMRGAVVSLSMSFDASTVLSGYERGALVLWDTDTLTPLREILDEFTTPITRLRHCYMDPLKIILLNSSGSVKMISFNRILSKMIYRLTNIAASILEAPFNDMDIAFMKEEGLYLVAAVSADTLLLSALECGLASVATPIGRRTQPSPSSWTQQLVQFVSAPVENGVFVAVAWGLELEIFSVAVGGKLTNLHRLANIRLERPLHAMSLITDSCLLLLDQKDVLHLLDASVGVVVETRVLHGVEPVVFSSRSFGMRQNAALAFMGQEAILLGRRRTFTCTLRSWRARLDALVEKRRFPEALELAKAFALEVALAVVGLHGDSAARRASIHAYLFHLITSYLTDIISTNASQEALIDCITSIIQFCSAIDAMDVFFGPAMDLLRHDTVNYSLALYCLEKCILSGDVTVLPDMYIQPFFDFLANETLPVITEETHGVSHTISSGGMQRAERVLMRLESNYELLMRIAEQHNLVRLIVSIFSYRQHRYVEALRFALVKDHEKGVAVSYFESTMDGYTISGDTELPFDQRLKAQRQLWHHLLTVTEDFAALLRMDPERTLSVTLLSLQESGPDAPWSGETVSKLRCVTQLFLQLAEMDISCSTPYRPWELARRRTWPPYSVVHELFTGITHLILSESLVLPYLPQFCEHACTHFIYEFQIAENEGERRNVQSELAALMTDSITKDVCFSFAETELRQQRMARALAALHCSRREYGEAIDCYLDRENNLADPDLSKEIFRVLRDEMVRTLHCSDGTAAQCLREAVMRRISHLANVDATSLAQFVLEHLQGEHEDVMNILRRSGGTFLRYLDELVTKGDPMVSNDAKLQNTYIELLCAHDPDRVYPYLHSNDSLITYDLHLVLEAVKRHKIADAAVFLLEKTLMIDEAMEILLGAVAEKLRALRQEVLTHVVSVCRRGSACSASSLLTSSLQKQGVRRIGSSAVVEAIQDGDENGEKEHKQQQQQQHQQQSTVFGWVGEEPLDQVLKVGIELCSKYNEDRDSQLKENWFRLLELFTHPRRLLCDRQSQHNAALRSTSDTVDGFDDDELSMAFTPGSSPFPLLSGPLSVSGAMFVEHMIDIYTKYVSFLLTHMIKVLDLSSVVCRIVGDHERERFGPFKPVIVDIMSLLSFELEVNRLCKISIDKDIMALGKELYRNLNRGVVSLSDTCYICEEGLAGVHGGEGETSVRIFTCGHGYHEACAMEFEDGAECAQCCKKRGGESHRIALRLPRGEIGDGTRRHERTTTKESGPVVGSDGGKRDDSQQVVTQQKEEEEEVSRVLRKLRHTRAKLDGARGYSDLLCSFLRPSGFAAPAQGLMKGSAEKKLLAPAPPYPVSLGEFSSEALDVGVGLTAGLTDDEVLEIFGPQEGEEEDDCGEGVLSLGDGMEFHFDSTHN